MSESVGKVTEQIFKLPNELLLECGQTLKNIELTYETYGELNSDASNAILICHALSGSHHAAGYYKDKLIGIKTLDTVKKVFPSAFLLLKKDL